MAGTSIQSDIKIDITAGNKLTGDAKKEFDDLRASLLNSGNTAKDVQNIFLKMKEILDSNAGSANTFTDATNKMTAGMQGAASAAKTASEANGELKESLGAVNNTLGGQTIGSLSQAKVAFTDVARAVSGQGFSLRNLTSNFGLLGPEIGIAVGALYEFYELTKKNNEVTKEFYENLSKQNDLLIDLAKSYTTGYSVQVTQAEQALKLAEAQGKSEQTIIDLKNKVAEARRTEAVAILANLGLTEKELKYNETELIVKKEQLQAILSTTNNQGKLTDEMQKQADLLKGQIDSLQKITDEGRKAQNVINNTPGEEAINNASGDRKRQQANETLRKYLESGQKLNEDAEQKEITSENEKFETLKRQRLLLNLSLEELEEGHQQNLANIRQKYYEKWQEDVLKIETKMANDQAKIQEESDKNLTEEIAKYITKSDEIGLTEQQKKIQEENILSAKLIEAAMLRGRNIEDLQAQHLANLAGINKEYQDKQDATEKKRRDTELQTGQRQVNSVIGQQRSSYSNQKTQLDNYAAAVQTAYNKGEITVEQYNQDLQGLADARSQILSKEIGNYAGYAEDIGSSLTKIGDALGEQTQTGKDIAIAGSIISTIAGAIKAFESLADIPYIGPELGIAAAAAALAAGYANVQKIEQVQIPGQSGGSSSSTSGIGGGAAQYSAPQIPTAVNTTNLTPQSINQIQSINQQTQPVRAYVVESDVTQSQQRVAGYRNSNTI